MEDIRGRGNGLLFFSNFLLLVFLLLSTQIHCGNRLQGSGLEGQDNYQTCPEYSSKLKPSCSSFSPCLYSYLLVLLFEC